MDITTFDRARNRATRPLLDRLAHRAANKLAVAEAMAAAMGQPLMAVLTAADFGLLWDLSYLNRTPTKLFVGQREWVGWMHHGTGSPAGSSVDGAAQWCLRPATGASFDIAIPRGLYKGRPSILKYVAFDAGWMSFHAGKSFWMGRSHNAVSRGYLGIETDNNNRGERRSAHQWEMLIRLMLYGDAVLNIPMDLDHNPTHFRAAIPAGRKNDIPVAGYNVLDLLEAARARKGQPVPSGKLTTGVHKSKEAGTSVRTEASTRGGRDTIKFTLRAGQQVFVRRVVPDLTGATIGGFSEWGEINPGEFVHGSLLVRAEEQFKLQPGNYTIAATVANVRTQPTDNGGRETVKYQLRQGKSVTVRRPVKDKNGEVISGSDEWGEIAPNEFIHASVLRRSLPSVQSISTAAMLLQLANQRFRAADEAAAMAHFGGALDEELALCFEQHDLTAE